MRHEPRALVGDSQHAVKLMSANTLLAGTKKMERHQPLVQRDVAVLEDRSNGDTELLSAGPAVEQARPSVALCALLAGQSRGFVQDAAVRADRTVRPALRFEVFPCLISVLKMRFEKGRFHTTIMRRVRPVTRPEFSLPAARWPISATRYRAG